MRAIRMGVAVVVVLVAASGLTGAGASGQPTPAIPDLDQYRITASPATLARLERSGFDVGSTRADGTTDVVLTPAQVDGLRSAGMAPTPWRDGAGRSVADLARTQLATSGSVWKPWDGAGGLREDLDALARAHPDLVATEVIGHSVQGRDLVALRVTGGVTHLPDGARPAVAYVSLQHAREWISAEVTRRLLHSLVDGYGTDPSITSLLDTTELWFVVAANPDGYQRTFDPDQRLWRKNTADNDGDGKITSRDGVDTNRNLPDHFGETPEGSSDDPADQTYRGPGPGSEPETKALMALAARLRFRFLVNYHSYGRFLLYPTGWQEQTPTADQPVYSALAGTPVNPAIPGYKPELATELYPTNGETTSWAHDTTGTLAFTVELGEGAPGSGFLFPDNEALVAQEYELNRPFALDVARSAADPSRPVSHLGNTVPSFVVDAFPVSYGDPQPVQATVPRRLGPVTLHWQVVGGPEQRADTAEWAGGLRYGAAGAVWEHRVRGSVTGSKPGDVVKAWFTAGGESSQPFTYTVETRRGSPVLVVVGGDHSKRTGTPIAPPGTTGDTGPTGRLAPVLAALAANRITPDVYDVDAHAHRAPDPLGVLGHYRAVVWTTDEASGGGDAAPAAGSTPNRGLVGTVATVSRLADQEMLAARDYLNDGGHLLYMGRDAGRPYADGREYEPMADGPCGPRTVARDEIGNGCVALSDDFFQYWLGAFASGEAGGATTAEIPPVEGTAAPFEGLSWAFTPAGLVPGRAAAAYRTAADALGWRYPALPGSPGARYRRDSVPGESFTTAAVVTPGSILFGFGFEDIAGPNQQAAVMAAALRALLPPG